MSRGRRGGRASLCVLCFLGVLCAPPLGLRVAAAQEPTGPQAVTAAQLQTAIDKLGKLDYAVRANASRIVRRTPAAQAVPALLQAVAEHADGYVRYRALVLLTGFNDPRTRDSMREALASPNDRLRAVAYSFFEHNPDRALLPQFLTALDKEQGEFVRPSLVRALAALAVPAGEESARVRQALLREVARGEDFFRSAVIEALGDYKAAYAVDAISAIAKLDGPLQDDAALALGKIGATSARSKRSPAFSSTVPASDAAVGRRGNLPARRQLRVARELPDRDAEVFGPERRLPGAAPRRGRRPRRAGVAGRVESAEAPLRDRHPVARPDARTGGARARDGRAAQHAADAEAAREQPERRPDAGDRADGRRVRHARRRSRQGALLRARAPHLLGVGRAVAAPRPDAELSSASSNFV